MTITIYDYDNSPKIITIPEDKEIESIFVEIISGDETGWIKFTDGTDLDFDASDCRMIGYFDDSYCVDRENIQKWIDWKPSKNSLCYSYDRGRFADQLIMREKWN